MLTSQFNPLTYQVGPLRLLMMAGGTGVYGLPVDMVVLLSTTAVLAVLAAGLYPRVIA